jgi:type IV secretory pathway TrbF-like protein
MLRLDRVIQPWREAAALCDHINLYGFWNEMVFLTKSGDVGMAMRLSGVDFESLDHAEQEYAVKRLESALKTFGPGFHIYQYLFKQNRPEIPFAHSSDPIVEAAIDQRRQFFESKRDRLYQIEIFYCIVLEGARSKTGIGAALARVVHDPSGAIEELKAQFTNSRMKTLLRTQIESDVARLSNQVRAFARQLSDFVEIEILNQQGQFWFFRRLVNYDDWRIAGNPQSTQFLDYQIANSTIESERDHLRVGDHIVRVLTMKEAITETRPLVLDSLLRIAANFYVVTEPECMEAEMSTQTKPTPQITRAAERYLEQYGDPLVMNTYLKVTILVLAVVCLALAALTFKSQMALTHAHPFIVRINDVGRAEAIDYRNFQYRPQEAENKYYLTRWAELYFSRNRFTIERDQTSALYFLNSDVQRAVIDQERKDNIIPAYTKDSSLPYVDVEVKQVVLDDLRQSPYAARIEFVKVFTNPADHSELKRERWTASVTYVFRENVKNNELAVNPLGLTIVRFRADQAFE